MTEPTSAYAISCDLMQEMAVRCLRSGCMWSGELPWGEPAGRPSGALLSDVTALTQEHDKVCEGEAS